MTHVALYIGQLLLAFAFGYFVVGRVITGGFKAYYFGKDLNREATLNDIIRRSRSPEDQVWINYCNRMLDIMHLPWYRRIWVGEIPEPPPLERDEWGSV